MCQRLEIRLRGAEAFLSEPVERAVVTP